MLKTHEKCFKTRPLLNQRVRGAFWHLLRRGHTYEGCCFGGSGLCTCLGTVHNWAIGHCTASKGGSGSRHLKLAPGRGAPQNKSEPRCKKKASVNSSLPAPPPPRGPPNTHLVQPLVMKMGRGQTHQHRVRSRALRCHVWWAAGCNTSVDAPQTRTQKNTQISPK